MHQIAQARGVAVAEVIAQVNATIAALEKAKADALPKVKP